MAGDKPKTKERTWCSNRLNTRSQPGYVHLYGRAFSGPVEVVAGSEVDAGMVAVDAAAIAQRSGNCNVKS